MRIKSLTLHGFKSFADRTRIDFHEGITAIVGPNGCGKSNISDALRWVLGEQRPTAIRGSRMEEAIFGGSSRRRPIHRAEVSVALSNEDGTMAVPYGEVVIGRTVYRGGESDYSLNGSSCRLKDILDLCRDTGLGANAYSVIEGRMIDAILSERAEERRALFEEAAEIGRYKDRRRTSVRRLEQAEGDLQRLDDVLGEVQAKVRSLAAQRGRADRYVRLRDERLRLEVAVASAGLERTREAVERATAELEQLRSLAPGEEAALRTAETEAEALRIRNAERERERSGTARRLEEIRRALAERERERLLAEERASAARKRIASIEEELELLAGRRAELDQEERAAASELDGADSVIRKLTERRDRLRASLAEREDQRRATEAEETRAREALDGTVRELERLRAEEDAAAERSGNREAELERRLEAVQALEASEAELRASMTALEERETDAVAAEEELQTAAHAVRGELEERRAEARGLRERVAALEGEHSSLRAREASLAAFLASGEGLPAVVSSLLESEALPGAHGVLADSLRLPAQLAPAVEAHLGPYTHAVVVDDWKSVEAAQRWLQQRGQEEGLLLLPLDPGPAGSALSEANDAAAGSLLDRVETRGPGGVWARALLSGVCLRDDPALRPDGHAWVRADGTGQDALGAVRLGQPGGGSGALRRRSELDSLRARLEEVEGELDGARAARESAETAATGAAARVEELERRLEAAAREGREAAAERRAAAERLERLAAERAAVRDRLEELEAARDSERSRAAEREARLAELADAREAAERALSEVRTRAAAALDAWEGRRAELHDLELVLARREADLRATGERRERLARAAAELEEREGRLRREREAQGEIMARGRSALESGQEEEVELLEERRRLEDRLREADETLAAGRAGLEARETALREARRTEREHAERRHALELEVSELGAERRAIRERVEVEWDAPLEELTERVEPPEEGDAETWPERLEEVKRGLARLGPVNLLAEEEYEQEKDRLDFLLSQREDLEAAYADLKDSIRRINRKAAEAFEATFEQVRQNFRRTFRTLFEGGECELWLEDPEDPLDSAIEISASPRGKRTQRIHLLSGGERALTALALLFAIYLAKPSPFCLMDEVDAPLDEANVLRFVRMLERFKGETQFVLITHNARTIEAADWIFGVTMQEPGVSSVVGVTFGDIPEQVVA